MTSLRLAAVAGIALSTVQCKGSERSALRGDSAAAPASATSPDMAWLTGDAEARFGVVARHLRGLDVAMLEIGHRYDELYWAGRDANWKFVEYQGIKIRLALRNAVERRPARAQSARMLDPALDSVIGAARREDAESFTRHFTALTATCNACHVAENVGFMRLVVPESRPSSIRGPR